ncbi:peptidylprolyl isomerase [Treponema pectinovorum]|uniref:MOSP complex formation periplasmic protein, TDE1658 family n=1 Tax=Treponema pectinovorum TaxID=164 RepID=UPI0011C7302E|nr:peptidylprolyl isomerase [Treponema pectinovorum]
MKRLAFCLSLAFMICGSLFAQADLQPLATVKLNKSETITLRQLKTRVEIYAKQNGISSFTVDQKKEILNAMIDEKLVVQAATKSGMAITDSQVNQYFLQNVSAQIGRNVTEAEFEEIVKQQTGKNLDEYMKDTVGMNTSEYKAYLKNQLLAQQFVIQQKRDEISKAAPSDEEIRAFYELNKASFVQNDMLKLFLVIFPKEKDVSANAAIKSKSEALLKELKDKKTTPEKIKTNAANSKDYQGGDLFISKTAQHAQQLGISYSELLELFGKDIGYVSGINETENDFQFYSIRAKYSAKMLSLSDLVQPETTITVYDYIKSNLTQQKQSQAMIAAVQEVTKTLDTPENVERKKTGAALDKLLNW